MKIGLDLHGVITDMPEFFLFFCESITKNGGEIFIVTGGKEVVSEKELNDLGFKKGTHYRFIFSIIDYMMFMEENFGLYKRIGYNYEFDNPEYTDKEWDAVKGHFCYSNSIALMIDDSLVYKEYFVTPFARLWTNTNTPKINKTERHLE